MNLVWFRNDLRTEDNTSLKAACDAEGHVIGVYFFDPRFYQESDFAMDLKIELPFGKTGKYRARFIQEAVKDLREQLQKFDIPLLVYHRSPEEVIPDLVTEYSIKNIYLQKEWTRDELDQENAVGDALESAGLKTGISGYRVFDQFLYHPDDIPFTIKEIPKVYTGFRKKLEKEARIRDCVSIDGYHQESPKVPETTIPTLEDLGLEEFEKDSRSAFPWQGGEKEAWNRLNHYFWETKKLQYYKKTRNGLIGSDYSSKFSAWLAIGCISPRQIYHEVKRFEKEVQKNQDTYWLIFELIWRDFFKYVSLKHKEKLFALGGILEKEYEWNSNKPALKDWMNGTTSEDFVNANMREIAATGFMSNRGRQNVASYWSMHLEQDWRIGAAYFEHILIDYDVHSNYGNWMYNSGVGNDPRNRTFNIQSQADRYDGDKKYRKLWLQDKLL
ncbi:DASH family cryptochrome [Nonlabens marinus]|uniref:Cryptochrome DASH n=1 Tax=Nonlabens marinus S1-08 TaxID=1454201 RepID=W8VXC3_9FLAO|nr:DASH family cryptochrome [Nonlabens marinus]BAO55677.1 cryptochrome [Nonlabens marinus S1-08]